MTHEYILWIATIAYAVHMVEETIYDWHGWVRRVLNLSAQWNEFYMVNAFVIVLGIGCAMVGWQQTWVALIFPAFMLVNAIIFHIVPVVVTRIFSPGLFTAVVLFLPVASWTYWGAYQDGVITVWAVVISSILGFLLMLLPIVLQLTKRRPMFSQEVKGESSDPKPRTSR